MNSISYFIQDDKGTVKGNKNLNYTEIYNIVE